MAASSKRTTLVCAGTWALLVLVVTADLSAKNCSSAEDLLAYAKEVPDGEAWLQSDTLYEFTKEPLEITGNFTIHCQGSRMDWRVWDQEFGVMVRTNATLSVEDCYLIFRATTNDQGDPSGSSAFVPGTFNDSSTVSMVDSTIQADCKDVTYLPQSLQQNSANSFALYNETHVLIKNATYRAPATVRMANVLLFCPSMDTSKPLQNETQFHDALIEATGFKDATIPRTLFVSGLIQLRTAKLWNNANVAVVGQLGIEGVLETSTSAKPTLDLYRNANIMQLQDSISFNKPIPGGLILTNLNLINLPFESTDATPSPLGIFTLLGWFANRSNPQNRFASSLLTMNKVDMFVECEEVDFLVKLISADVVPDDQLKSDMLALRKSIVVTIVQQDPEFISFSMFKGLGILGSQLTVTCKSLSVASRIPTAKRDFDQILLKEAESDHTVIVIVGSVLGVVAFVACVAAGLLLYWRRYSMASATTSLQKQSASDEDDCIEGNCRERSPYESKLGSGSITDAEREVNFMVNSRGLVVHSTVYDSLETRKPASKTCMSSNAPGSDSQPSRKRESLKSSGKSRLLSNAGSGGASSDVTRSTDESGGRDIKDALSTAVQQLEDELQDQRLAIRAFIGRGGFGVVYRGTWRGLEVAVKTVVFQSASNSMNLSEKRAIAEAAIAFNLSHENVVNTFAHELKQIGSQSNTAELSDWKLYLIQEFCGGGTLSKLIQKGHVSLPGADGVNMRRILTLLKHIAVGMEFVHSKRILHGDLNPANVLLKVTDGKLVPDPINWSQQSADAARALDAGRCTAKITDFGLSVRLESGASHISNIRQGTPFYAAPELIDQNRLLFASDVYSYGVIMWELFKGHTPYVQQGNELVVHPDFPKLRRICPLNYSLLAASCMTHNPNDRPVFSQVIEVLESLEAELSTGQYIDSQGVIQDSRRLAFPAPWALVPGTMVGAPTPPPSIDPTAFTRSQPPPCAPHDPFDTTVDSPEHSGMSAPSSSFQRLPVSAVSPVGSSNSPAPQ